MTDAPPLEETRVYHAFQVWKEIHGACVLGTLPMPTKTLLQASKDVSRHWQCTLIVSGRCLPPLTSLWCTAVEETPVSTGAANSALHDAASLQHCTLANLQILLKTLSAAELFKTIDV